MAEGKVPESKGYLVKVRGEYFAAAAGNRKILARYEIDVKLPSMDRALSVIKNKLLDKLLKLKYPDYINYRTHELVSFVAIGAAEDPKHLPLHLQGREQLVEYIEKAKLPIDVTIYLELSGLRKAIALCETDPKKYAEVAKADRAEYEEDKALQDLNPEMKRDPLPQAVPPVDTIKEDIPSNEGTDKKDTDLDDETGLDL